jgi:hypothetical protein
MVLELERMYDSQAESAGDPDAGLSPELENFLKDVESRLSDN